MKGRRAILWPLAAAALGFGAPPAAHAERAMGAPRPEMMLKRMDADGDGRISKSEFRGPPQQFSILDSDADGYLSKEELTAFLQRVGGGGPKGAPARGGSPLAAWYEKLPVILTHTHFNILVRRGRDPYFDWGGAERNALALMDENGIRAAIIMPAPGTPSRSLPYDPFDGLLRMARKHPDRFRVSGGGATLNVAIGAIGGERVDDDAKRVFAERAEAIVSAGAVGFGEMAALHFSLFDGHAFEQAPPDHPLFLLLADLAAKHRVPIDLHVEAVTRDWTISEDLRRRGGHNPERVSANIAALERLLDHNRGANIIWVHVGMDTTGQRTVELTRRMLRAHPNLYLSITSFQNAVGENWFVVPDRGLNPNWRALIVEFPDRFTIGSDVFFQPENVWHAFPQVTKLALRVVRAPLLPPAVARKVAFENAQRLFRLNLIDVRDYPLPAAPAAAADGEKVGPRGLTARQVVSNSDRDGDGRLARDEFRGPPQKFRMLDRDGDGFLTREEIEAGWQ
jgi:hypothetical protein